MVVSAAARGSIALIKQWKHVRAAKKSWTKQSKEVQRITKAWDENKALFNPKKYPGARGTPKHTWETSELGQMATRARQHPTTGNVLALHAKILEKQQQRRSYRNDKRTSSSRSYVSRRSGHNERIQR